MTLYVFSAPLEHATGSKWREIRTILIFFFWGMFTCLFSGYSMIVRGNNKFGYFICLCSGFIVAPITYFFRKLRRLVGTLPPRKISKFLFMNVIFTGLSSLMPMIYLSAQSVACIPTADFSAGETYYSKCSGISYPIFSINTFLLSILVFKVVIAPLSSTSITFDQILSMLIPTLLKWELAFAGMSFICNLILFGRIEEGKASGTTNAILALATYSLTTALFLELGFMVFLRRTGETRRSTVARSSEIGMMDSLSSGMAGGFI